MPKKKRTPNIKRVLYVFEKHPSEVFIKELELHGVTLEELRTIMEMPVHGHDPEMYDIYPVKSAAQATALARFVDEPIDLINYDYSVACYDDNVEPGWVDNRKVRWVVRLFENPPGDAKVASYELRGADPKEWRAIMGHPDDTSKYPCYEVETEEQLRELSRYLDLEEPLQFGTYRYYINGYAIDEEEEEEPAPRCEDEPG